MSADPVTAAIVLAAGQQAQKSAARAQGRALEANAAQLREQNALDEADLRRRNRQAEGRQRALFAKSGVRLEGTPMLVQSDTAEAGAADLLALRQRGDSRVASLLGRAGPLRAGSSGFPLFL
jgi:hypothetical protein